MRTVSGEVALSETLAVLYDSIVDPTGWPTALAAMTSYVGGSSAMLFHQDRLSRTGTFVHAYNTDPEWTRLYFERYVGLNPVLPFTAFMDVGSTTSFLRIIDSDEFRASRFYREWAAPQRFQDVVVTVVDKSATAMGLFAVTFTEDDGLPGDVEISRMELLAPHVRRAVQISRLLEDVRQENTSLVLAVELLPQVVFFLDARGKVQFTNQAATMLLKSGGVPLRLVDGGLVVDDALAARALRSALHAAESGDPAAATTLSLGPVEASRRWIAHLLPIAARHAASKATSGTLALLFVREVGSDTLPALDTLVKLYGFTPRELQVFVGVVQFGSVPEAARVLGLSPTTVRSHLQHIFDKTGVRRQSALVRIANTMIGVKG